MHKTDDYRRRQMNVAGRLVEIVTGLDECESTLEWMTQTHWLDPGDLDELEKLYSAGGVYVKTHPLCDLF